MIYKRVVQEVLRRCLAMDLKPGRVRLRQSLLLGQDSLISMLVHDIFGGEILKTHLKNDWHFYNRVDGERIDLTLSEKMKDVEINKFEDIPASESETSAFIDRVDYHNFFMRFVKSFEEAVGLKNYENSLTS